MKLGFMNRKLTEDLAYLTVHDLSTILQVNKSKVDKRLSTPGLNLEYYSLPKNWIVSKEAGLSSSKIPELVNNSVYFKIAPFITKHICEETQEKLSKLWYQIDFKNAKWALDTALELGVGSGGSVALTSSKAILREKNIISSRTQSSHVAIKRFTPKEVFESDEDYCKRHATELYLSCMVDHENIIYANCALLYEDSFHLVMEYCPTDFFKLIATESLKYEEIDNYFIQMIRGVRYLHYCGIAHRDLKIENFMVTEDDTLKIIDFGFATTERPSQGLWGSDPYMAPEIFDGSDYDPELADVWSLAIIYFSCINSRFPWDAATQEDLLYSQFLVNPASISKLLPSASRSTILRMLNIDPNLRPTIHEVWSEPWIVQILENYNKMKLQI